MTCGFRLNDLVGRQRPGSAHFPSRGAFPHGVTWVGLMVMTASASTTSLSTHGVSLPMLSDRKKRPGFIASLQTTGTPLWTTSGPTRFLISSFN